MSRTLEVLLLSYRNLVGTVGGVLLFVYALGRLFNWLDRVWRKGRGTPDQPAPPAQHHNGFDDGV